MNLKVDGAQYSYRTGGSGEPVLLLHAFPLTSEAYWPQLEAPPAGVRVICPDHRGFGGSDLKSPVTLEAMAKDAFALLDALKLERAIVGGVSMGGYVAMAMTRLDPARIKGLILADTQATADDAAQKEKREGVAKDVEKNGMSGYAASALPNLLAPEAKPYVRARIEGLMKAVNPAATAAAARAMAGRDDSREILARYAGPAVVIVGEHDTLTPPAKARELQALLPKSRLVTIPGAGHLSNVEAPLEFNEAVRAFVESTRST
ncbi:MAG: alpha/beta fold hydrolase [Myxococcaceae bacterium]|nr:alpha/beta fold hydrolase [Myxococcaceae bacterium]